VARWQQKRHWTSAGRSSGLEVLEEMEQMMTAVLDDTVDILHVVHDKAIMKDMIAAQTVFVFKSSSEGKSNSIQSSTQPRQEGALSALTTFSRRLTASRHVRVQMIGNTE
jgi:hypothetical protein